MGLPLGFSSSANSGNDSAQREHRLEYMAPKIGSDRALSKIRSMMPTMSAREATCNWRNCPVSFSNFSGASLFNTALQSRSNFSPASTSFFAKLAAT
eukprot:scaffold167645_cov23-Tisochrysis_lutea.AAC.1